MEDPFSLFEIENNPLRASMRQILEQLPNNSEQVKAVFKSLLLVHVSKIEDPEERSTWQSFIDTLDNFSNTDQATYSFGPLPAQHFSNNFEALVDPKAHYHKILKLKSFHSWRIHSDIQLERKKALKCVMFISFRLRYVESFWRWQMFSGGLEKIMQEFYLKNLGKKIVNKWKNVICDREKKFNGYYKADQYWTQRNLLVVMINWTALVRDSYKVKMGKKRSSVSKTRKFAYENVNVREKSPMPQVYRKMLEDMANCKKETKKVRVVEDEDFKKKKTADGVNRKNRLGFAMENWKSFVKYRTFSRCFFRTIQKNLVKTGFISLRIWTIKGNTMKRDWKRHSIDHLSDYELSVKISIMERKLSALHNQLLSEQISNGLLLSEKEELVKIYNYSV